MESDRRRTTYFIQQEANMKKIMTRAAIVKSPTGPTQNEKTPEPKQ